MLTHCKKKVGDIGVKRNTPTPELIPRLFPGELCHYAKDNRWVLRFVGWFFKPNFALMLSL